MSREQISVNNPPDCERILSNAVQMTVWLPGLINLGVLYLIGVCTNHLFDMTDYAILTWLFNYVDKTKNGKSTIIRENFLSKTENCKMEFVWVNYQKVIEQLPIINIDDRHTISRRFSRYCNANILEFHFEQNPSGSFTFYRINQEIKNHLVSKNQKEMMVIPGLYGNGQLQKYFDPVDLKVQGMNSDDQSANLNVQRVDANVQSKDCVVNNSIVNTSTTENSIVNISVRNNVIFGVLDNLFGSSNSSFSKDFIPSLIKVFEMTKLYEEKQKNYLEWVFNYSKGNCKDQTKLKNYFYRAAKETNLIEQFMSEKPTEEIKHAKKTYICPVCHTENQIYEQCSCGLPYEDIGDKAKIEFYKRVFNMTTGMRASYESEYKSLYSDFSLSDFRSPERKERENAVLNLQRKYGLID